MKATDETAAPPADLDEAILNVLVRVEPGLSHRVLLNAVRATGKTKPKRRRLAEALLHDATVLTSGGATGPLVVNQLIDELQARGATHVRRPPCPHCGHVKPLPYRAADGRYICRNCATKQRCANCDRIAHPWYRDRNGQPRCRNCQPNAGTTDPVADICAIVTRVDPTLEPDLIRRVVLEAVPRKHHLLQLFWKLDTHPEWLTGNGGDGSPHVKALIEGLRQAGSLRFSPSPCPRCGRVRPLTRRIEGEGVCSTCYSATKAEICVQCQKRRPVGGRGPDREPLCRNCWANLPMNREMCVRCGQHRAVHGRGPDGQPFCSGCYLSPMATCSICGRERPCYLSATSTPRCESCSTTRRTCAHCGETKVIVGRSPTGSLCEPCYRRDPSSFRRCTNCGTVERLHHHGLCARCACDRQLSTLLRGRDGLIQAGLAVLHTAILASDPGRALTWLQRRPAVRSVLAEIAAGECPLTHEAVEEQLPGKVGAHLRAILVAAQALPARDEHLANLELWLNTTVTNIQDLDDQRLIRTYINWHHLRALRGRLRGKPASANQTSVIQRCVAHAVALLDWLRTCGKALATCCQADIDYYLASGPASRYQARQFLLWAHDHGHTGEISIPSLQSKTHVTPTSDRHRWATARRLLEDDTIALQDRVAGLLVLLYAQPVPAIVQLTIGHVIDHQPHVLLKLGPTPLLLPPPVDSLLARLKNERRGHASVGRTATDQWLFPGARPGLPLSSDQMKRRLRSMEITARPGRAAALLELAAQMPAAVLHQLLGVSVRTAVDWCDQTGSSWSGYASEVSRR